MAREGEIVSIKVDPEILEMSDEVRLEMIRQNTWPSIGIFVAFLRALYPDIDIVTLKFLHRRLMGCYPDELWLD